MVKYVRKEQILHWSTIKKGNLITFTDSRIHKIRLGSSRWTERENYGTHKRLLEPLGNDDWVKNIIPYEVLSIKPSIKVKNLNDGRIYTLRKKSQNYSYYGFMIKPINTEKRKVKTFKEMNVKELREYLKNKGVIGTYKMKKNDLLEMIEIKNTYKKFEDIPIGKISHSYTPVEKKIKIFEKLAPHRIHVGLMGDMDKFGSMYFRNGDIVYFKSRKIRNIPYEIIDIMVKKTNVGIFGLESSISYLLFKNLKTGVQDTKKTAYNIGNSKYKVFRSLERIKLIDGKTIWLEPKNWYENLKKRYGY